MKLLLFSDLHADAAAARSLVKRVAAVDVLLGAGDFGNVRTQLPICIDILRRINSEKPVVLVAGNNETTEELIGACRDWPSAHILHGSGLTIDGMPFFGVGGGIPTTPFGSWSYDFSESEATQLLASCPEGAVLITHSPPKGAVDRNSPGESLGSTAIRDIVLSRHPRLVVCGHIHASAGQTEMIGDTPVVNAGPDGIIWEIA